MDQKRVYALFQIAGKLRELLVAPIEDKRDIYRNEDAPVPYYPINDAPQYSLIGVDLHGVGADGLVNVGLIVEFYDKFPAQFPKGLVIFLVTAAVLFLFYMDAVASERAGGRFKFRAL